MDKSLKDFIEQYGMHPLDSCRICKGDRYLAVGGLEVVCNCTTNYMLYKLSIVCKICGKARVLCHC